MAGDWLKMDSSTPDKPEVLAITARMGWDDPDLTVGKLFRVWRWFDQQTVDGNAPGVTSALLDRIAGVTGFADAMRMVGWLVVEEGGLSLPKFDRHNGATAKARAQTAKRVASHRGNGEGNAGRNADSVTGALAREDIEKKKKEEEERRRAALPDDHPGPMVEGWSPSTAFAFYAKSHALPRDLDLTEYLGPFIAYYHARHELEKTAPQWDELFARWVAKERKAPPPARASPGMSKQTALEARNAAAAQRILEAVNGSA